MSAKHTSNLQRGFSLVTAIFLMVVLSALGAMLLTFFSAQQKSFTLDIMGARAYQAARAGIDWGAFQIIQSSVAGASGVAFAAACLPGPTSSPLALDGTLSSFRVTVGCRATSYVEAGTTLAVYDLTSSAVYGGATLGQSDYVERVIDATIAR